MYVTPRNSYLRCAQIDANMLLDAYREVYYTGGVSSVYLWDLEEAGTEGGQGGGGSAAGSFAGCFLILKRVGGGGGEDEAVGCWETSHVVQVCTRGAWVVGVGGWGALSRLQRFTEWANCFFGGNGGPQARRCDSLYGSIKLRPLLWPTCCLTRF